MESGNTHSLTIGKLKSTLTGGEFVKKVEKAVEAVVAPILSQIGFTGRYRIYI